MNEREKYKDLTACCEALYEATGREVAIDLAVMLGTTDMESVLAQQGLRIFAPLACGSTGAVFKTTAGQVLRLRYVLEPEDAEPPAEVHEQLQPIAHGVHDKLFYEILPQVTTDVSKAEEIVFEKHLDAKGYYVDDFNAANGDIGKLPDGTFVAVDKGAIRAREKNMVEADNAWLMPSDQVSIFPYLHGTGLISRQEHFYPALRDKRVRGILSDDDLARLGQGALEALRTEKPECFEGVTAENLERFLQQVKAGLYPSQAQEVLRGGEKGSPPHRQSR